MKGEKSKLSNSVLCRKTSVSVKAGKILPSIQRNDDQEHMKSGSTRTVSPSVPLESSPSGSFMSSSKRRVFRVMSLG
jgi:hypothetical protein